MSDELTVQDGQVVSMNYSLHVDGELVEESDASEPLEFIQGQDQIIPGLEQAIYGMKIGETKNVVVSPDQGYGDVDEEAFVEVPKSEFPHDIPLEVGIELDLKDEGGEVMSATILSISPDSVMLDFNHPLAGKHLEFNVKIVGLRVATEEEMEHGHVHGDECDCDECDCEEGSCNCGSN